MRNRFLDWFALTLLIVGAINWGLIGFFRFDLLGSIFGGMGAVLSRVVFAIVGIAGLYCLTIYRKIDDQPRYTVSEIDMK